MAESLKARVVGAGYVGLVIGACLYHLGYRAACVDKGKARLRKLREVHTLLRAFPIREGL